MEFSLRNNSWYVYDVLAKTRGVTQEYLQSVKYEMDKLIYNYGDHFNHPTEAIPKMSDDLIENYLNVASQISDLLINHIGWDEHETKNTLKPIIVCNAYFSMKNKFEENGYIVHSPIWENPNPTSELENLIVKQCYIIKKLFTTDFSLILSDRFVQLANSIKATIKRYYAPNNYVALVLPYQVPFFEYVANHIFQELEKKTFFAIHGLNPSYSGWSTTKIFPYFSEKYHADYYLVWGDDLAKQFPKHGIAREKVIVTGHPDYDTCPSHELRFGFEDVLVCTLSICGAPIMNLPIHQNRANIIDYVHRVQFGLQKVGVKKARLRPHPSESKEWYWKFIDHEFFTIDELPLNESLKISSLVVGPASSVFIEALFAGTNYVIFDPSKSYEPETGIDFDFPFSGSDSRIPVATNEKELEEIFLDKKSVAPEVLGMTIQTPFSLQEVSEILKLDIEKFYRSTEPESSDEIFNQEISKSDELIIGTIKGLSSNKKLNLLPILKGVDFINKNSIAGDLVAQCHSMGEEVMAAALKLIELGDTKRNLVALGASDAVRGNIIATSYPQEGVRVTGGESISLFYIGDSSSADAIMNFQKLSNKIVKNGFVIFNKISNMDDKNSPLNTKFNLANIDPAFNLVKFDSHEGCFYYQKVKH